MKSLNNFIGDFLKQLSLGGRLTSVMHKEAVYGKAQENKNRSISIVWVDGSQNDSSGCIKKIGLKIIKV